MKKFFIRALTIIITCTMVISSVSVLAAQPVPNDDGENYTFIDSFTDGYSDNWTYNNQVGWGDPVTLEIENNLTFNDRGEGTLSTITADWLSIESRAAYNSYDLFPGANFKGTIPNGRTQNISFVLKKGNTIGGKEDGGQVGGGIRFLVHDNGNSYYELYVLRGNDDPKSPDAVTYILSKVENGNRTVLYKPAKEDPDLSYQISPYDVTHINITVIPEKGEISYDVTTGQLGRARLSANSWGTYQSLANTVIDSSIKDISDNYGIQLFAAGQGGSHALFTNFSIQANGIPTEKSESFTDDFSSYEQNDLVALGSSKVLNNNWKSYSGIMGYDENGTIGVATETSNQANLLVPALVIEARSDKEQPWMSPCMVYTGNYPMTEGYDISFKMFAGRGGGLRIATDESIDDYYEVYLKPEAPLEIAKVENSNDNATRVRRVLYTKTSHEGEFGSDSGSIARWNNVYRVNVKVYKGEITFIVNTLGNGNYVMTDRYTVVDSQFPYKASKVALFASGQGGEYTRFTDFSISSYDIYTNQKTEPKNVLYYNAAKDVVPGTDGVIELEKPVRIRKVQFTSGEGKVEVSKDNEKYFTLFEGSEFLNTKTSAEFKYVKIPVGSSVKIYTDVEDGMIEAHKYSSPELILISDGNITDFLDVSFSDGNNGYTASYNYDGTFYVKGDEASCVTMGFGNTMLKTTLSVSSQYMVKREADTISVKAYFDKDYETTTAKGIICAYDSNGKLSNILISDANVDGNLASFTANSLPDSGKLSIMLWKDINSLQALCNVYELD